MNPLMEEKVPGKKKSHSRQGTPGRIPTLEKKNLRGKDRPALYLGGAIFGKPKTEGGTLVLDVLVTPKQLLRGGIRLGTEGKKKRRQLRGEGGT